MEHHVESFCIIWSGPPYHNFVYREWDDAGKPGIHPQSSNDIARSISTSINKLQQDDYYNDNASEVFYDCEDPDGQLI